MDKDFIRREISEETRDLAGEEYARRAEEAAMRLTPTPPESLFEFKSSPEIVGRPEGSGFLEEATDKAIPLLLRVTARLLKDAGSALASPQYRQIDLSKLGMTDEEQDALLDSLDIEDPPTAVNLASLLTACASYLEDTSG